MTHLVETQGLIGGLQPMRHKNSKRKRGPDTEDLERADGSVRNDPERALRLVRFFFSSNFLPLPEFLRVLNHLIENGRVRSVAWSPDGNCMASGSDDKTIKVWNTKTGQCQSTLTGHSDS